MNVQTEELPIAATASMSSLMENQVESNNLSNIESGTNAPTSVAQSLLVVNPPLLSEWQQLLDAVKQDPYSSTKWNRILEFAERSGNSIKISEAYESLLQVYPNVVRWLYLYLHSHISLCFL